jgi:predicted nucleotide-binding protein
MAKNIFIISSIEGLEYAKALKRHLNEKFKKAGFDYSVETWSDGGIFPLTNTTIESLEKTFVDLSNNDGFVIAMMTPDDPATIKGISTYIPRDNVVFELGMAFGKLGRSHSIIIKPETTETNCFHMLTDVEGITYITYEYLYDNLRIGLASGRINDIIYDSLDVVADSVSKYIRVGAEVSGTRFSQSK